MAPEFFDKNIKIFLKLFLTFGDKNLYISVKSRARLFDVVLHWIKYNFQGVGLVVFLF